MYVALASNPFTDIACSEDEAAKGRKCFCRDKDIWKCSQQFLSRNARTWHDDVMEIFLLHFCFIVNTKYQQETKLFNPSYQKTVIQCWHFKRESEEALFCYYIIEYNKKPFMCYSSLFSICIIYFFCKHSHRIIPQAYLS